MAIYFKGHGVIYRVYARTVYNFYGNYTFKIIERLGEVFMFFLLL